MDLREYGATIPIRPLSVNKAFQGRRFKSNAYHAYEKEVLLMLPIINVLPEKPYEIHYVFGFSSKLADLGNPEKLITDLLCKKYGFDDRYISRMVLEKEFTAKGKEFISFTIKHYTKTK